jgi:hypothetical protein
VLATQFKQHDVPTVFLDGHTVDALTTVELREAFPILTANYHRPAALKWPQHVAVRGANVGLRRFEKATRWRINVDLRDDHQLRIPSELDLRLALGRQTLVDQWSVTVTLNNRLIHEDILDLHTTSFETRIPLPKDIITASNLIEVTATSTRINDGDCTRPIELIAEMLPETILIGGDEVFSDALSLLQDHLSAIGGLSVGSISGLTAADADAASDLLARTVPVGVALKPETRRADIVVVTPNDTDMTLPDAAPMWFVSQDGITGELIVARLAPNAALPNRAFGLLIVHGGINLAEVSL